MRYFNLSNRIISSTKPLMIWLRVFLVSSIIFTGLVELCLILYTLTPSRVYNKDLIQDYLMTRAVIEGINPYLPASELGELFLTPLIRLYVHLPSPHPPSTALVFLPLGLIPFRLAATIWLLLELVLLVFSVFLLWKKFGFKFHLPSMALVLLFLISWRPIFMDLFLGQWMILLLVLLIGTWISLGQGKNILAGFLLGCSIALKMIVWPILLLLLINKNWKAFSAAVATFISANLIAGLIMGFDNIIFSYIEVSRSMLILYRNTAENLSFWSYGWRLVAGSGSAWLLPVDLPPLLPVPSIAPLISIILPFTLLLLGVISARRLADFNNAFSVMVIISIGISPIVWSYYLILAILPILIIFKRMAASSLTYRETIIYLTSCLILSIPDHYFFNFIKAVALSTFEQGSNFPMLYLAALLTFLLLFPIFGLIWLLNQPSCQENIPPVTS